MREVAQFRIDEQFAPMLFSESEGKRLGDSVRKVDIPTNDPRFKRIGELQTELLRSKGKPFFYGWKLTRNRPAKEVESAQIFHLRVASVFEPAGEECGTKYDETAACSKCGAGAKQEGPLLLDVKRIPKGKDFAKSIAGEVVVSRRVTELFAQHGIRGATLHPVRAKGAKSLEPSGWSQLVVRSTEAEIVAPTRVGNDPFDDDPKNEYRCPQGHLLGLNLLSELSIIAATVGESDIVASRQFIGVRRGLLRPERVILVSPKLWRLIDSERLKGCEVEVAHLV
jgi:hypothetical protein